MPIAARLQQRLLSHADRLVVHGVPPRQPALHFRRLGGGPARTESTAELLNFDQLGAHRPGLWMGLQGRQHVRRVIPVVEVVAVDPQDPAAAALGGYHPQQCADSCRPGLFQQPDGQATGIDHLMQDIWQGAVGCDQQFVGLEGLSLQ